MLSSLGNLEFMTRPSFSRENFILLLFGSCLGGLAALGVFFALPWIRMQISPGSNFANVAEFQRAMLQDSSSPESSSENPGINPEASVDLRAIVQPHPKMEIMYDLRPELSVRFQRVPVRTNSCGMRGAEVPYAKAPGVFRIAVLGDSFTFGWGVEEQEGFVAVLERVLQSYVGGEMKMEVLNFGVPGYSTFQQVAAFEEKGLDFRPDVVLVFFIENDFGLPFFIRDTSTLGQMISAPAFTKRVSKGEETDNQRQERRKLETLVNPNRWLLHLRDLGHREGFPVYLAINPRQAWKEDYGKLWALRPDRGIHFIPMRDEVLALMKERNIDFKSLSLPHDPHPSPIKHQLLGEVLAQHLWLEVKRTLLSAQDARQQLAHTDLSPEAAT